MEEFFIHRAAEIGDEKKVKHFLKNGVAIDINDNNSCTPLHLAAKGGHFKVVEFLIKRKCNLDLKTKNGSTAVLLAAENKHKRIVDLLIRSGADANSCCSIVGKWSVLHHASREGWTDTVKLLVRSNRRKLLNAKTTLDATPLLLAAYEGHIDVVELLIDAGAKVNCCDADSWTVLHYAAKAGWLGIVKKIAERMEVKLNVKNSGGVTPLLLAACEGHKEVVEFLIDAGSNVDRVHRGDSSTVLHYAAKRNWLPIVRKILKISKSSLNSKNSQGNTPLHIACSMHNTEIIKELLLDGADATIVNKWGENAFMGETMGLAATKGNIKRLEYLIQMGVSIDSCENMGNTPLHLAVKYGNLKSAKFLIDNNCSLNPRNVFGEKPLWTAATGNNREMVSLLLRSGADANCGDAISGRSILHIACSNDWKEIVKCILERDNIQVDAKTLMGNTPLMCAVEQGSVEVAELLLETGANVHACAVTGNTALHYACRPVNAVVELVKLLLVAGADANMKNSSGKTPFDLATEQRQPCLDVIKLLIEHGACMMSNNIPLRTLVLNNVDLCTQLLVNKYNKVSLPAIYKKPECLRRLPQMSAMVISNTRGVAKGIAKCVEWEIESKTYCDVMKVRPMVLTLMCVEALINPQKTITKKVVPKGPVKRSARLALLKNASVKKKC